MGSMAIIITATAPTAIVRKPDIAAAAIAIVIALGCGTLAALSLAAALVSLPADRVADALRRGETVPDDQIVRAASASLRAGGIFERGRYFSDAALELATLQASRTPGPKGAPPLATIVDQALIASPASPHNWARRAAIQLAGHDLAGARRSLETSLLLGRYVPGLTVARLRIMLALIRQSPSPSLEAAFEEQVRIAARTDAPQLARFADGGAAEGRVQRILVGDYALFEPYLRNLTRLRDDRARAEKRGR